MILKRITAAAAALALGVCAVGCGNGEAGSISSKNSGKLSIVCTIFPEYDWVREILGDKAGEADITCLINGSSDLHSYQPTAEDIMKISACDMLVYVGGESDTWVDDALKEATNKDMKVISLMDVMGDAAKEEEVKEGMQAEEEEEEGEGEEEPEYDEHVWLSVRNAETLCGKIAGELCELDPDNKDSYNENLENYTAKLKELDTDFETLVQGAESKTLIFGDRFPFRYFTDDYGLDYYAAFVGCSAESEASFETITFLASKVDELGVDTIYTLENPTGKIAQSVIDNTKSKDQKIAALDSMQSVSQERIDGGETYLTIMKSNYDVLKADLG